MYSLYKGVYAAELEPSDFSVGQNYPNPFKGKTVIKYCVAYKTRVQITVYDSNGKEIEKLVDEVKSPGTYEVEFSAHHYCENGNLPAGRHGPKASTYFYCLVAGDYKCEKRMELISH